MTELLAYGAHLGEQIKRELHQSIVEETIIATALIDTGPRMDEVIFEEFKGTATLQGCLDAQPIRG